MLGNLLNIGASILDKVIPDPEARAAAKLEMARLQQDGEFRTLEASMSAIVAEAKSADKWTSRARPSFMYVMYVLILAAIPMGFVTAWNPELAQAVIAGMGLWLRAIPEQLYWLFGTGYLGYTGARSFDKAKRSKP